MPTDATVDMTPQEKKALAVCVSKEYFDPASKAGVFVEWLKAKISPIKSSIIVVATSP